MSSKRTIKAPTGTTLTAKSWLTEAPLRMLMNNLDPDVAERPEDLRRKPMCFHDGHFWTVTVDEDDNPYAVKFKLGW